MKYMESIIKIDSRQMVALKYIFDVGVAERTEIMTEVNTNLPLINKLVENELVKYVHDYNKVYYYLCHAGFEVIAFGKEEYFNYVDYIEPFQKKIHQLLDNELRREIKTLESDFPGIFEFISRYNAWDPITPLGRLRIDNLSYFIEAEESMRSELAYTKMIREYAKHFRLLRKHRREMPHGIVILKGNISGKFRSSISSEQLDFKYIFEIFQRELGELTTEIRLLYVTPSEFKERVALLLNHKKEESKLIQDLQMKISKNKIKVFPAPVWEQSDIEEIELRDNEKEPVRIKYSPEDPMFPIFYDTFPLPLSKKLEEDKIVEIFTWHDQQALKAVSTNNSAQYILLQRCEGNDSKPWVRGVELFKDFSEEFPNSKVICYFQKTLFEPYHNKLDVLNNENVYLKDYYDAMYLLDLRDGNRKWCGKQYWSLWEFSENEQKLQY